MYVKNRRNNNTTSTISHIQTYVCTYERCVWYRVYRVPMRININHTWLSICFSLLLLTVSMMAHTHQMFLDHVFFVGPNLKHRYAFCFYPECMLNRNFWNTRYPISKLMCMYCIYIYIYHRIGSVWNEKDRKRKMNVDSGRHKEKTTTTTTTRSSIMKWEKL